MAKRSNIGCQTFEVCLTSNVWPFRYVTKHCSTNAKNMAKRSSMVGQTFEVCFTRNFWPFRYVTKHCLTNATPWPNDQTFLVKHLIFALQAMFDRLTTSQNILWQAEFDHHCFWKTSTLFNACIKQNMLDEKCFVTWPHGKIFCLKSKFRMFDKQC